MNKVGIGLIGLGTVGGGVARWFAAAANAAAARVRVDLDLARCADIDRSRAEDLGIAPERFADRWESVVEDPAVDVVVELIGGTTIAEAITRRALDLGKPVVTANKALLAKKGDELFAAAAVGGTGIYFEASVCGGIPLIKSLREGLVANRISRIWGILNGTCNYIMTQMEERGDRFEDVLREAQENGYAEADPGFDVDGIDASHKAALLAALASGSWYGLENVDTAGIRAITLDDVTAAARFGYRIKLIARVAIDDGQATAWVQPTLVPKEHPLAAISGVYNGVYVRGDVVGDTLYYGRGAGADATASAILADIIAAAVDRTRCREEARPWPPPATDRRPDRVRPCDDAESLFYLRMTIEDRAGVLSQIAGILGERGISIAAVRQEPSATAGFAPLTVLTHAARRGGAREAIEAIDRLDCVRPPSALFHVEDFR